MKNSKLKFSEYMQNISRSKSFGKFVLIVYTKWSTVFCKRRAAFGGTTSIYTKWDMVFRSCKGDMRTLARTRLSWDHIASFHRIMIKILIFYTFQPMGSRL